MPPGMSVFQATLAAALKQGGGTQLQGQLLQLLQQQQQRSMSVGLPSAIGAVGGAMGPPPPMAPSRKDLQK